VKYFKWMILCTAIALVLTFMFFWRGNAVGESEARATRAAWKF